MRLIRPALARPLVLLAVLLALMVVLAGAPRPAGAGGDKRWSAYLPWISGSVPFTVTPVGRGFNQVTDITHAGDDRLFIAQRQGMIRILHPDDRITTFLDVRGRVISNRGEYGFFAVAFHPGYTDPASPGYGFFYVSYTTGHDDGQSSDVAFVVSRFRVSADPDVADAASETALLSVPQVDDVHKGGGMEFDPRDNRLYVGLGDDRQGLVAQDAGQPLGKIVRLAVDDAPRDASGSYPLVAEVWVLGLRNPWRFDVDVAGEQIVIGDVGHALWEEVNVAPLRVAGLNYGWPCVEGEAIDPALSSAPECGDPSRFKGAIYQYPHDGSGRCAIIGGKVYRPATNPDDGRYIFTDMCSREIMALERDAEGVYQVTILGVLGNRLLTTIGEDRHGAQYAGTTAVSAPIYRLNIP